MDTLLIRDVESLAGAHRPPCISLYLPTDRTGAAGLQGPVRFKNLLKEAAAQLASLGWTAADSKDLLAPLGRLAEDFTFWSKQSDGLALFYSPDHLRTFRLPVHFAEQVTVGERFTLRPLMPLALGDDLFYVLAMSRNEVRLIEAHGRREGAQRLAVRHLPKSLTDALGEQETTETLQFHSATAARHRAAVFHGQGAGHEDEKVELLRYARSIETPVREALRPRTAPLVLAGAEPLPSIYREVNAYPQLLAEGIAGNPDHASDAQLAERGWALAAPYLAAAQHAASDRFGALLGTGRASRSLEEILPAALQGRVATLFLDDHAEAVWGRCNADVKRHRSPEPGDQDLLDAAAVAAWTNGATVFAVPSGQVPGGGELAAIFRY